MKITIVFDNYLYDPKLKTEWGFSCFIEGFEKTILFDTGSDGKILLSNIEKFGLDIKKINTIFISHDHWDHTGGLQDLLAQNQKVVVYLLQSFSKDIKTSIRSSGAEVVEITSPASLCEAVTTTGELGSGIKEQSLVLETGKGLVIITGCAHPGIVNIIENIKKTSEQKIHMVFGGFHLGGTSNTELKEIIEQFRKFGVEKAGPCHCSGDQCRKLFADDYKNDFVNIGVGKIIQIQ